MTRSLLAPLALVWLSATPALAVAAEPPALIKDPATGMELILVRGGCFQMGDIFGERAFAPDHPADEYPVHEVCVDDLYVGRYEVTQAQWDAVMGSHQVSDDCREPACPVTLVSWEDIQAFLQRLRRASGTDNYRLPTEAEWEYAARSGGQAERFAGGNDVESVSWHRLNTGYSAPRLAPPPWSRPVGLKAPNGLGLYDMSGNVYELTSDFYGSTYYAESPRKNPTGPATGERRVQRGGCAHGDPTNSRTARRREAAERGSLVGFRLVRAP